MLRTCTRMCKEAVRRLLQSAHDALLTSTSATLSAEDDVYDTNDRNDDSADFAIHRKMLQKRKRSNLHATSLMSLLRTSKANGQISHGRAGGYQGQTQQLTPVDHSTSNTFTVASQTSSRPLTAQRDNQPQNPSLEPTISDDLTSIIKKRPKLTTALRADFSYEYSSNLAYNTSRIDTQTSPGFAVPHIHDWQDRSIQRSLSSVSDISGLAPQTPGLHST
jgi:hypothetical protein